MALADLNLKNTKSLVVDPDASIRLASGSTTRLLVFLRFTSASAISSSFA